MSDTDQPVRVVLVDDDPLVRAGLSLMLGGSPEIEIVAQGADGVEGVAAAREHRPDVVLMDIRMPKRDGLAATRILLDDPHPPRIVILTTFDTDDLVLQALQVGAQGFLLKDTPPPRMVEAIVAAARGEPVLSPTVASRLIAFATRSPAVGRREAARSELAVLTERERDVAAAIGTGKSNAEIAGELYMSVATVKAYVTRILTKLGLDNRVQIAMKVHDAELTD